MTVIEVGRKVGNPQKQVNQSLRADESARGALRPSVPAGLPAALGTPQETGVFDSLRADGSAPGLLCSPSLPAMSPTGSGTGPTPWVFLATEPRQEEDNIIEPDPLISNMNIRRFTVKNETYDDIVIDVKFLKHVIDVLIRNHNITTTPKDLNDILTYFGEVDIKTQKQTLQKRGVNKWGLCSSVDVDEVVEIVQKILVNGVNILKRVPDFIQYLAELGINF